MKRQWQRLFRCRAGHSYFKLVGGSLPMGFKPTETVIGIADDSGNDPDSTDDGALFLDTSKPITMGWGNGSMHSYARIPLLDADGEATTTTEPCAGALRVACAFGMKITTDDGLAFAIVSFEGRTVRAGLDAIDANNPDRYDGCEE